MGSYGYLNSAAYGAPYTYNNSFGVSILASAHVVASEFNATSDRRAKENITDISTDEALRFVDQSRPVHFKWRDQENAYNFGFIAQDVDKLGFRELVAIAPDERMKISIDDDGYVSPAGAKFNMNYNQIVAILTKAMQAFKAKMSELVGKIMALDQSIQSIKDIEIAELKAEAARLKARADKADAESAQLRAALCEKFPDLQPCMQ